MSGRAPWLVLVGCALLAGTGGADEAPDLVAVPNRPTASTTAESVKAGVFEVEGGFEAAKGHQNVNGLLKLGASDGLELWAGGSPFERDDVGCMMAASSSSLDVSSSSCYTSGLGDSLLGFKLRFVSQHGDTPSIGILYVAKLPTANEILGSGAVDHSLTVLVSKDYGHAHVDFNAGVEALGRPVLSGFDHDFVGALALSYPLTDKAGLSAEISGGTSENTSSSSSLSLLGAFTYSVKARLVLDTALSIALHGDAPRATVLGGLTYSVGHVFRR